MLVRKPTIRNIIKTKDMLDKELEKKIIGIIVDSTKDTNTRLDILRSKGYNVRRCYVTTYNKLLGETVIKTKGVIRIIVGRPKDHYYKEVYAVELPL